MNDVTILVAGGRDFCDYEYMEKELDKLLRKYVEDGCKIKIIEGEAEGAEKLAKIYGTTHNFEILPFSSRWDVYKFKALSVRNSEMLHALTDNEDDKLAALFWDGKSDGTFNILKMLRQYDSILLNVFKY